MEGVDCGCGGGEGDSSSLASVTVGCWREEGNDGG